MARKIIQDVFIGKEKKRDSVAFPEHTEARSAPEKPAPVKRDSFDELFRKQKPAKQPEQETESAIDTYDEWEEEKPPANKTRIFIWVLCIASIATLLFVVSSLFATAIITITPKSQTVAFDDTYPIYPASSTKPVDALHYHVLALEQQSSVSVDATGETHADRKGIGRAVIYNNYGTSNQRLVTNTRLEAANGLVYRIRDSITVPGMKTVSGIKVPGSIEVDIIADQTGDTYNMKLTDFKGDFSIPGFQGTDKYNGFYGRLSADVTGGYSGTVKTANADAIALARKTLEDSLSAELIKNAYREAGDASILFKNNYTVQFTDLPDTPDAKSYQITEKAALHAIVFDAHELAEFVAKNKIAGFDGSPVDILWDDKVNETLVAATPAPWTENTLKAKFSGTSILAWSYDPTKIIDMARGHDTSIASVIATEYTASIAKLKLTITPAWESTLPADPKKIKIVDTVRQPS